MESVTRHVPTAIRVLLGTIFVISGLNGFLQFMPFPPMPDRASAFLGALGATGYFLPVLKTCELLAGVALLVNRFVPLALVLLAPVVVQIALFHTFLAPAGLPIAVALVAMELALAWFYRDAYRDMLDPEARPARIEWRGRRFLRT